MALSQAEKNFVKLQKVQGYSIEEAVQRLAEARSTNIKQSVAQAPSISGAISERFVQPQVQKQEDIQALAKVGVQEGTPEFEQATRGRTARFGGTELRQGGQMQFDGTRKPTEPGIIDRAKAGFEESIEESSQTIETARQQMREGNLTPEEFDAIATRSGLSRVVTAPFGAAAGAISPVTEPLMEEVIKPYLQESFLPVAGTLVGEPTKLVTKGLETLTSPVDKFTDGGLLAKDIDSLQERYKTDPAFKAKTDSWLQTAEAGVDFLDMLGLAAVGRKAVFKSIELAPEIAEQAGRVAVKTGELAKEGVRVTKGALEEIPLAFKQVAKNLETKKLAKIEAAIEEGLEKGVAPRFTGKKKTLAGVDKWKSDARTSVNKIIDNKASLALVDEFGEAVEGVPQTLKQFSDAIDQTKKKVFSDYDALSKEAGSAGIILKLDDIGGELDEIIGNKVLQTERPEVVEYAKTRKQRYKNIEYTPEEAQEAIKVLNQSLDWFYRHPSFDSASIAYVDALAVNQLRRKLDTAIEGLTGKQYQKLKSEYSALKNIEKDVIHRTLVDARKKTKGLLDFTDIFSGGEVVAGIMSMNPAMIAKGAVQKGIKDYFKFINNPNTQIKRVFEKAEKLKPQAAPTKPSDFSKAAKPTTTSKVAPEGEVSQRPEIEIPARPDVMAKVGESNLILYTKDKGQKTFSATNVDGRQTNLMEATLVSPKKAGDFAAKLDEVSKRNPGVTFQLRDSKNGRVVYDSSKKPAPLPKASPELKPLYEEARKYKSAEEFVKAADRVFEKRQDKAFNDPFRKIKYSQQEEELLSDLDSYLQSEKVLAFYEQGKRDAEILTDIWKEANQKN